MNEETARTIVIGITAVGTVAWLAGLAAMFQATRERLAGGSDASDHFDVEGARFAGTVVVGADVDGHPEALTAKLAERLARNGLGPFGPGIPRS
jgi:hypothetical protein